jgi:cell division transport system permease protein
MNILSALATEVRIAKRIGVETLKGLWRSGWMNLVILVTMASILTIFGAMTLILMQSQMLVSSLGNNVEISVYLDPSLSLETAEKQIKPLPGVRNIEAVSKEEAWTQVKQQFASLPEIENPLPDTLHVKVASPQQVNPLVDAVEAMDGVEKVNYPYAVVKQLQQVAETISYFGLVASVFLGVLTAFIISNTIHLLIEARSREIEILRMMGVGNLYIQLPFLAQGSLYGLGGSVLALLPLWGISIYLDQAARFFDFGLNMTPIGYVFLVIAFIGIGVGASGSIFSIRRYLQI